MAAGLAAFAIMALAQIWIPLTDDRAGPTVVVVVAAATATWAFTARAWGWRRSTCALVAIVVATLLVERVGIATGWPFGRYRYSGELRPEVWHVPVIVPLAWFALGLPAIEAAARLVRPGLSRIAVAAAALTAWDLFLDPQMVHEGYWRWTDGGPWRNVPVSNFAGWFVVSFVVLGLVDRVVLARPWGRPSSLPLLGIYTWWTVMETLGFLVFFGDPLVALVAGPAMGVPTVLVWRRIALERTTAGEPVAWRSHGHRRAVPGG